METQTQTTQNQTPQPILILDKVLAKGIYFYDSELKTERTKIKIISLLGITLYKKIAVYEERGEYTKVLVVVPTTDTKFMVLSRDYYCCSSDGTRKLKEYYIYINGKWYKWYRDNYYGGYYIEEKLEEIEEPDRLLKIYKIRNFVSDLNELEEGMVFY